MPTPNVECQRCGHRWYAPEYEERSILPHYCPRCYREEVREIPEPPSFVEQRVHETREKIDDFSSWYDEKSYQFTLWKENHRELIELGGFLLGMLVILGVIYVFIFVWG